MRKNSFVRSFALAVVLGVSILSHAVAEELKPFLTVKVAGPEAIMKVAASIAKLADMEEAFEESTYSYKNLDGLNTKGPIGFILRTDGEELKEPLLILPVVDVNAVTIPGFEMITTSLKEESKGKYLLNTPLDTFAVTQQKDFLLITPQYTEVALPENPTSLIEDLKDFTLAIKIDLENTSLDSIENLIAPYMMLLAMQGGTEMAQVTEQISTQLETIHKEFSSMTFGIRFDPKTYDTEFVGYAKPRKDSDTAEQVAKFKKAGTIFSGFRRDGNNVVFSCSGIEHFSEANRELTLESFEPLFDGLLESVEDNAEDEDDIELAEAIVESVKKVLESTMARGKIDMALSLDADGMLLGGMTMGQTGELQKIRTLVVDRVKAKYEDDEEAKVFEKMLRDNLKENYATVEGFKLSTVLISLDEILKDEDYPDDLKKLQIRLCWAVRDNEAVAFALGTNPEKTENEFKKALEASKSPVPLRQPLGFFALKPLGELLAKFHFPETDETAAAVTKILRNADAKAKIEMFGDVVDETVTMKLRLDGTGIKSLVNMFKTMADADGTEDDSSPGASGIQDF